MIILGIVVFDILFLAFVYSACRKENEFRDR